MSKNNNQKAENIHDSDFFEKLNKELSETDYNCKANVYIDEELSGVFARIKKTKKINMSTLISYVLEQWSIENNEELKNLPSNKYLS